nr:ATP synthase F0 subunit 8 [Priolepis farcimen]
MPQLNPNPWFAILGFSWLVFLVLVVPLTLTYLMTNEPSTHESLIPETEAEPWAWPWN